MEASTVLPAPAAQATSNSPAVIRDPAVINDSGAIKDSGSDIGSLGRPGRTNVTVTGVRGALLEI